MTTVPGTQTLPISTHTPHTKIDLAGQRAIVTGGSQGLGRAIADRLCASGAQVWSWDLQPPESPSTDLHYQRVDVSSLESIATAIEAEHASNPPHILVSGAATAGPTENLWDYPVDAWRSVIEIGLIGTFNVLHAVLPLMIDNGYGRVLTLSSIAGKEGNARSSAYSASKGGIIALTKAVAKEAADRGVLVNSMAPAAFDTPIWGQTGPGFREAAVTKIPLGRLGRPEELASMAAWLCSAENSFSTGAVFDISGGRATY